MDQEETKIDAPVKPAKTRAPRKNVRSKASAAAPEGGVGTPAASPAPEKKVTKPRTPRRKKETPVETPAVAEAASPAVAQIPAAVSAVPQENPHQEPRQKKNKPRQQENAPEPAKAQPPVVSEQKVSASAPQELAGDIPEPPAEFRKPEPVPGFAMPEIVGGSEGGGNSRRKRRRNRNRNREDNNRDQQQNPQMPRVDPEELYRRAWKIFLGEVTEEGLALMDDRTAAEASRRAFKVAEIFLLEAARHRPVQAPLPEAADNDPEAGEPLTEKSE